MSRARTSVTIPIVLFDAAALLSGGLMPAFASQTSEAAEQVLTDADRIDGLLSLVAVHDGRVVVEGYFDGTRSTDLLHLRSGTKSVTSLLVGIALDRGLLRSVDQSLAELIGRDAERFGPDKARVTLRHLLTMTAGLAWDESDVGEYNRLRIAADPLAHYLSRAIASPPGTEWSYSSGASHVLSIVLARATGMNLGAFAERHLFGPLGIERYTWETMADGHTNGAAGLALTPRDVIKLGELMLGRGIWAGRRIVSAEWIEQSTRQHVTVGDDTYYGYHWWIGLEPWEAWLALGYGGQTLVIVPELNAVAAANTRWRGLTRPAAEQSAEVQGFLKHRLPELLRQ